MKKITLYAILIFMVVPLTACSVVQATRSPEPRDLSVLNVGTDRLSVLAELGKPLVSDENKAGEQVDLFKFIQGQHGVAKAGKGLIYGVLAVGTLGLSEIVTSPLEGAIGGGAEMQIKVTYDENDSVKKINILKDGRWVPVQNVNNN